MRKSAAFVALSGAKASTLYVKPLPAPSMYHLLKKLETIRIEIHITYPDVSVQTMDLDLASRHPINEALQTSSSQQ